MSLCSLPIRLLHRKPTVERGNMATLASKIASTLIAIENCQRDGKLHALEDSLPSGSGIDGGTKIDKSSKPDRLILTMSFHHMDETGTYDGWTEHAIIVKPSLAFGVDIKITGRDKNGIKEYLAEVYQDALTQTV